MLRHFSSKCLNIGRQQIGFHVCRCSTSQVNATEKAPKKEISKAMKAYLERARNQEAFMKEERLKYQIGKRHLANMMGENPETFTQEDVDEAIAYLFPSGLFEKKARPMMKPPEEIFPQQKAAEFDEMGRPHHFLFYTGKPNYYQVLYNLVENINEVYKYEDVMIKKNLKPDPNLKLELTGYQWIDKTTLEGVLLETLTDRDYATFVTSMDRLAKLSCSYKVKDFIMKYCKPLMNQTKNMEIPKLQYEENGRAFITVYECMRKDARGHVTLRSPGTGQITINGQDIKYFHDTYCREQIRAGLNYEAKHGTNCTLISGHNCITNIFLLFKIQNDDDN